MVPGTVLVDGLVAAMWRQEVNRTAATLTVELLRPVSQRDLNAVTAEARRLVWWTGSNVAGSERVVPIRSPPNP